MTRERLPDRRKTWRQKVKIGENSFYCDFGEYPDGRLGEIFIDAHKEGTFSRGVLGALARMVSIALQCGTPVEDVVKTLRYLDFPPNGEIVGEGSSVKKVSSIVDWIAQEIEAVYCKGER